MLCSFLKGMDRGLFLFIKKSQKNPFYPFFWIVFIWHSASLPLLGFIPHLPLEKLEFCAPFRSVCSTPSFLTFLHPFPAQSMEDSWWGVSSKTNIYFGHSEFLYFTWNEIVFAINTWKWQCLIDDNNSAISHKPKDQHCCSQRSFVTDFQKPRKGQISSEEYKKAKQT